MLRHVTLRVSSPRVLLGTSLLRNTFRQTYNLRSLSIKSEKTAQEGVVPQLEGDNSIYHGPLAPTFKRLKIFSLASLTLSGTLAPFMFIIESSLPLSARFALASIAIGTSGISTALVGWCGMPYVTTLKRLAQEKVADAGGIEMTTVNLFLQPHTTRVYDPSFLVETRRAFAKWELASALMLPNNPKSAVPGQEETVAETIGKDGIVVGRWIVKWGENGEGTCREVGRVIRYFNVHEELLN